VTTVTKEIQESEVKVREIIGQPGSITISKVLETGFYTMDGRIREQGLFTPGGDSGEFILALQIYQDLKKSLDSSFKLEQADVKNLIVDYLKSFNQTSLRLATDDQALSHL